MTIHQMLTVLAHTLTHVHKDLMFLRPGQYVQHLKTVKSLCTCVPMTNVNILMWVYVSMGIVSNSVAIVTALCVQTFICYFSCVLLLSLYTGKF